MTVIRQTILWSVLTTCGLVSICNAVGFGNLTVSSQGGQPLSAEIQLTGLKDIDPFSLQATLASPTDFDRAGIARSSELYNLVFEVSAESPKPAIIIHSLEPVNSSVLQFMVELVWAEGKLVKQFTIYLEPSTKKKTAKQQTKKLPATNVTTELLPEVVPDIDETSETNKRPDITKHELYRTPVISKTKPIIKNEADVANKKTTTAKTKPAVENKTTNNKKPAGTTTMTNTVEIQSSETTVTKTDAANSEPVANVAPITQPIRVKAELSNEIVTAPNLSFETIVNVEPQTTTQTTNVAATQPIAKTKPIAPPVKKVSAASKKPIQPESNNYWNLVMLGLSIIVAVVGALFIRRKYIYEPQANNEVLDKATVSFVDHIPERQEPFVTEKFTQVIGYSPVLQMKIDLARQYLEIGDRTSAASLLTEVIAVADDEQKNDARSLKQSLS